MEEFFRLCPSVSRPTRRYTAVGQQTDRLKKADRRILIRRSLFFGRPTRPSVAVLQQTDGPVGLTEGKMLFLTFLEDGGHGEYHRMIIRGSIDGEPQVVIT